MFYNAQEEMFQCVAETEMSGKKITYLSNKIGELRDHVKTYLFWNVFRNQLEFIRTEGYAVVLFIHFYQLYKL